jgi:hypothetical protein
MKKSILIFLLASLQCAAQSAITWNMGMNLAAGSFGNMHPRMVTDAAGNPVVIFGRMSDQSVFISRWNGTAFTMPVQVNPVSLTIATMSWQGPDIAAKGDTMYIVMKQTPETDTSSHIYLQRSFDGGITFSMPVQVDQIADSISRFPTVAIDTDGNPVVAFMKFDANLMDSRWVVARSNDLGNTFLPDSKASGWSGGMVCDCCPGALLSSGNNSLMLYRDNLNNVRDMWAGISTDNANTFTSGMPVDQNNWMITACPASGPDGVIAGDTLYTAYMSAASGSTLVYVSRTSVSTMNGSTGYPVTGAFAGLSAQNYPRIATDGTAMAIGWKQRVSGVDQFALLFTNDLSNDFPAAYDTVDITDVTNVDVAISNGNMYTVWEDDAAGTVKYRTGTFNSTTGVSNAIAGNSFYISPNPAAEILDIALASGSNGKISVTDILGKQLYSQQVSSSQKIMRLNISEWNEGVYFISLQAGKNIETKKFVK